LGFRLQQRCGGKRLKAMLFRPRSLFAVDQEMVFPVSFRGKD
jgi:hypothetical protein